MGEINWTPELVMRAERNIAEYYVTYEQEQTIADALSEHADEHYRRALNASLQAKEMRKKLDERDL